MKRLLSVLGVFFWLSGASAYAQCYVAPNGDYYCPGYLNAPSVQPPVVQPYNPYFSPNNPFWLFYTPVCHYEPDVWGWRKECRN